MFSFGSDRVVACCEALTNDLVRHGLHPHKAMTIHNGVTCRPAARDPALRAEVRQELGIPEQAPVIVCVARFAWDKGLDDLLLALARILVHRSDVRLLLVGNEPVLAICEVHTRILGIEGSVHFLGLGNEVNRVLAAADIFALPSWEEGLPHTLAEAMAAGLPVVATAVGGIPEIMLENLTGFLVDSKCPGRLAEALLKLIQDPVLARRMGQAAKIHVAAHFTLEQMVTKFEALYQEQLKACTTGMLQRALLS